MTAVPLACPGPARDWTWNRIYGQHSELLQIEGRVEEYAGATLIWSSEENDTGVYEARMKQSPHQVVCRFYVIIAKSKYALKFRPHESAHSHMFQRNLACANAVAFYFSLQRI